MENEMNIEMEKLRRKLEDMEDDYIGKENEIKKLFNDFNSMFIKVREKQIFSSNEEFSEIKTEDIKYLIIPFYLSELIQKFNENRTIRLEQSLKFYEEFYKILNMYSYLSKEQKEIYKKLTNKDEENEDRNKSKIAFEQLSNEREEKIKNFKYKKALSDKLKQIEKNEEYDSNREYWLAYLDLCWMKTLESIKCINLELDSINFIQKQKESGEYDRLKELDKINTKKMEVLKINNPSELANLDVNSKLAKNLLHFDMSEVPKNITVIDNIISNKLNVRDNVFRPTNLPTMTLDEFAEKEKVRMLEMEKQQEEAKLNKPNEDSDDEIVADEKTYKAREWDDWKDLNEKGSGNKMSRK